MCIHMCLRVCGHSRVCAVHISFHPTVGTHLTKEDNLNNQPPIPTIFSVSPTVSFSSRNMHLAHILYPPPHTHTHPLPPYYTTPWEVQSRTRADAPQAVVELQAMLRTELCGMEQTGGLPQPVARDTPVHSDSHISPQLLFVASPSATTCQPAYVNTAGP